MEELRNSQSYIDAYAKYIKTGKDKEIRAMLTENAPNNGQIPVPEFVYDTVKTAWEDSELLRYVRKLYVKGNLKVGFEISSSGAEVHPEGGDPIQEEQLQIGVVELVPEMVKKYVMLSDELEAMASRDFLTYVYDELTHQIALKLESEIINAITNQPVGVTVPEVVNYGTNPKPETIAMVLSKLTAEAKNPVAIMNRGTWGEFKKAQYEANYPIDVFEKLTVIFSDALSSFADASVDDPYLIVGDFENGFLMNYPEGDEIRIKRDDITLATQDLVRYVGRVYCAMGVIAPKHFAVVNKGDEATPIVPTGNIEITENGENINVAPYATATVNVSGGGDIDYDKLPMCKVTVINGTNEMYETPMLDSALQQGKPIMAPFPSIHYRPYPAVPDRYAINGLNYETATSSYSDSLFTELVNCTLNKEVDGDMTYWEINVTDKSLPASVTIDVTAFTPYSG